MPKMKTKKAMKKRVRFTKSGKIKRAKACKGHILTKKSGKRKRGLRKPGFISKTHAKTVKRLLPYG